MSNQTRVQTLDLWKFEPIVPDNLTGLHRLMQVVGRVSAAYQVTGKFGVNYHLIGLFALAIFDLERDTDEPTATICSKVWRLAPDIMVPASIAAMNTAGILPYASNQQDQPSWQQVAVPPEWPTAAEWESWQRIEVDVNYSIRSYTRTDPNGEPEKVIDKGHAMYHTHGDGIEDIDTGAL